MNETPESKSEPKSPGVTKSHIGLYQKVAAKEEKILQALFDCLESRNESIKIGAAKALLNKILPDLKSVELGGSLNSDGTRRPLELFINTGRGFIPATVQFNASSTGGTPTIPAEIQSDGVAPTSTQDDNSNTRDSKTGSS